MEASRRSHCRRRQSARGRSRADLVRRQKTFGRHYITLTGGQISPPCTRVRPQNAGFTRNIGNTFTIWRRLSSIFASRLQSNATNDGKIITSLLRCFITSFFGGCRAVLQSRHRRLRQRRALPPAPSDFERDRASPPLRHSLAPDRNRHAPQRLGRRSRRSQPAGCPERSL